MPRPLPMSTPCLCSHTLNWHYRSDPGTAAPCEVPGCECEDFAALAREVRWSDPTLSAEAVREKLAENGIGVTAEQVAEARGDVRKKQVGGNHYLKHKIQPWDIWQEYGLNAFEGAVLKYLLRRKENRVEDLKKARHTLDRLIEIEEQRGGE